MKVRDRRRRGHRRRRPVTRSTSKTPRILSTTAARRCHRVVRSRLISTPAPARYARADGRRGGRPRASLPGNRIGVDSFPVAAATRARKKPQLRPEGGGGGGREEASREPLGPRGALSGRPSHPADGADPERGGYASAIRLNERTPELGQVRGSGMCP